MAYFDLNTSILYGKFFSIFFYHKSDIKRVCFKGEYIDYILNNEYFEGGPFSSPFGIQINTLLQVLLLFLDVY